MDKLVERKPAALRLLIRLVVKNEKGEVIQDTGQMPSHSFVIQFLEFVYAMFDRPGATYDATDINNAENEIYKAILQPNLQFRVDGGANVDDRGIVVGTGLGAESNIDYKLSNRLTEGVGAGQITYGACSVEETAVVGANVDLEINRSFVNNTGASIVITEAGIYTQWFDGGAIYYYHCVVRDLLASSITLDDKCTLTVYYTLRTTVSV